MAFFIGDIVRCTDKNSRDTGNTVKGLAYYQRFQIVEVVNWPDGSQSLYVQYRPKSKSNIRAERGGYDETSIRGPYSSVRFSLEGNPDGMFRYDPSQLGDLDDGI